jgi:hypothetical protein
MIIGNVNKQVMRSFYYGVEFFFFSLAFMIAATSVALADNQTNETNVTCVEDVNCDEWSACVGGLQTSVMPRQLRQQDAIRPKMRAA